MARWFGAYLTCLRCGSDVPLTEMGAHAGPHTTPPPLVLARIARRDYLLGWGAFGALTLALWLGLRAGSRCVHTR